MCTNGKFVKLELTGNLGPSGTPPELGRQPGALKTIQGSVIAVSAGYNYSLALTSDGIINAFGHNPYRNNVVPEEVQGHAIAASAGYFHSLILTRDGRIKHYVFFRYTQFASLT